MDVNKIVYEHINAMEKHKSNFDRIKAENAHNHSEINKSINEKFEKITERRKKSDHFSSIHNRLR